MESVIYSTGTLYHDLPMIILSLGDIATAGEASAAGDEQLFIKLLGRWREVYDDCNGSARGYALVILSAEDDTSHNGITSRVNRFGWLMWKLRSIDYEYRKNVKKIFIVYPSWLTRVFMPLFLPMISSKAYAKIQYTRSLFALSRIHGVSLTGIKLSMRQLATEARTLQDISGKARRGSHPSTVTGGLTSIVGKVWSVIPFLPRWDDVESGTPLLGGDAAFGSVDDLIRPEPAPLPRVLAELRSVILSEPCNGTEGIFRRSSHSPLSGVLSSLLALPDDSRPMIPWQDIAADDPLLPPAKLQSIIGGFSHPVISPQLYPAIRQTTSISELETRIFPLLSPSEHRLLSFLAQLIVDLLPFEPFTKMSAKALAICFAPALIAGPDPVQDAALCLAPGQSLPVAMTQGRDLLQGDGTVVGMLMLWAEYQQKAG